MTRTTRHILGGIFGLIYFSWIGSAQAAPHKKHLATSKAKSTTSSDPWLGASRQARWAYRSASVRCLVSCAPPANEPPPPDDNRRDDRRDDRRDNRRDDRRDDRRDNYRRDDDRRDDRRDNYRRDDRRDTRPPLSNNPHRIDPTTFNLIAGGWGTFGGSYLATILVALPFLGAGNTEPYIWLLFVPVVGPFIGLGYAVDAVGKVSGGGAQFLAGVATFFYGVLGFASGLAQLAGLIMAIIGHVRHNAQVNAHHTSNQPTWHLVPYARQYDGHQEAGFAAVGRF